MEMKWYSTFPVCLELETHYQFSVIHFQMNKDIFYPG